MDIDDVVKVHSRNGAIYGVLQFLGKSEIVIDLCPYNIVEVADQVIYCDGEDKTSDFVNENCSVTDYLPEEHVKATFIRCSDGLEWECFIDGASKGLLGKVNNLTDSVERIMSPALYYSYLNIKTPENPYSNTEKGIVITGPTFDYVHFVFGHFDNRFGHYTEGFMTNFERFVDRDEALKIAIAAGQVPHTTVYLSDVLLQGIKTQ